MGVGVGDVTRGVLGTWYCCDIVKVALKEWNGGKAEEIFKDNDQEGNTGCIRLVVEWSFVSNCFSFAIVTVIGPYCPCTSVLIAGNDMAGWSGT